MIFSFFSRSFAPKESIIFQTKIYPKRIGVSRLYVTYVSDDVCSLIQSIPIEIISEPIKQTQEPLLQITTEKVTETKFEEVNVEKTPDKQEHSVREEETKTATVVLSEQDKQENKPVQIPSNSLSINNEDDDDVDEPYLKKKLDHFHSNATGNSSALRDSTLSLDKDKMSIDSLDVSNDRRQLPPQ